MATYKIIGNEPITMSALTGGFIQGKRITALWDDGYKYVVKVEDTPTWADVANEAIRADRAEHDRLGRLGQ